MDLRSVGTCLNQTFEDVGAQIDVLDLHSEMKGGGLVDAIDRVYIALLMRENVFEDIGRPMAHANSRRLRQSTKRRFRSRP